MARIAQIFAAVGLRDKGGQSQQQASAENGYAVVETLAQTRSSDGDRTVGHTPNHDRVHYAHAHPAHFSDDQRQSQAQSRAELPSQWAQRSELLTGGHT